MTSPEPQINKSGFSLIEKRFPLGMGFLLTVLKKAGHEVTFIDQYLKRDFSFNPDEFDFIGIYANTPCYDGFVDLLEYLKDKVREDLKIAVGVPHASVFPDKIPAWVDYIVQGEGEEIICDLVDGKIKDRIIRTGRIKDLDTIDMPDYDTFVYQPYITTVKWFPGKVFTMNTSRGCPFDCSFCSVKKIWGRKYTYMSADRVIRDVEHLVNKYGIEGVYFREDNFTLNKDRVLGICKGISPLELKWAAESRVDTLDRDMVKIMAESGCTALYIGFESGSQHMLDIYNKKTTIEQGLKVGEWCHESGIKIAASFIIKHPDETDEDRRLTKEFICKLKPTSCWENPFREDG